ncbi:MAG: glycerophosphodiester phosphodiesterase [Acidimicrobiales bacterium]|nr:glycerophosphodiester phosphodiesterase [Acidimicrobiales bacterium]
MTDVIAHRGASARRPENTTAAFEAARSLGADAVELDVRRTRDGIGVVRHDAHLPDGRLICGLDAAEVPAGVPRLPEALEACAGMEVNIEIKNVAGDPDFDPDQAMADHVVDTVVAMGLVEQVVVSSFGFAAIERVRTLEPGLRTAWLVVGADRTDELVDRTAAHGHAGIHPHWAMVDASLVERAHEAGLFVNTWTVDDPHQMRRVAELGVDGIVTNVPDVALAALGRR